MAQESRLVIVIDSKNAERNTRAIADELANLTVKGDLADSKMTAMSSSIKSLVGYMGGILTISKAISMADGYTQMAARIRNATQSAEEYDLVQNRLLATANTTFRALGEAQEVYLSMAGGMKSLGKSTKDTLDLSDSLSFSFTANATRADQAQSAMDSLSKSMAKGKIDADAWISIVTGADNVIADMAKTTGKTEAEIRKLGASGKASLEDLIKTLIATREQNEQLANNMENSLADGFTKLSNEVTVYLGKANEATSATGVLASGLGALADNLDVVANTGAVLGIGYVTAALLAKGAAVQKSIADSVARVAADQVEIQSQLRLAALEVQRTRQVTALAAQEIHLARLELNSAVTRTERAAATMRLTQAEVAHAIALKGSTAATAAETVAQNSLNASRRIGATMLGLVGGPIGAITLGVTALAAGYMYMSSKTAEANKKLEEQGQVAKKTREDLLALEGVQRQGAKNDLAESFEAQNKALKESNLLFNSRVIDIQNSYRWNAQVVDITNKVTRGVISQDDAIKELNKLNFIDPKQLKQVSDASKEYEINRAKAQENADAQKILGNQVKLTGNEAQNAAPRIKSNTDELNANETAAQRAAQAQKGFFESLNSEVLGANENLAYLNLGFTKEVIEKIGELQKAKQAALGGDVTAIITTEEINQIVRAQKALDAVKDKDDEITKAKRDQTSEAEKQAKLAAKQAVIMAGSNEQTKNMLKVYQAFRNAGVDDTKARVLTAQVGREGDFLNKNLFGSHTDAANKKTNSGMISWQGSRSKSLTQYLQGQGVLDKKGNIEQTQEALNAQAKFFIQEIMTEKRYSSSKNALLGDSSSYRELEKTFGKNAIAWDYSGKNIGSEKASKNLARQDNYYNSLNKVLGGNPENALSSIKDIAKYDDDAYKARKDLLDRIDKLQSQYDTEAVARSKARDEEILQATILSQNDLIPKIKERYDAEDKIAKLQQKFDVEGHKWTEERKLQYTYETNVLRLTAEGKFSEDQKKIFEKGLKDQYEQEQGLLMLARETRIFQFEQAMYTEMELIKKRYDFELQEAARLQDPEERARRVNAASSTKKQDESDLLWNSTINYSNAVGIDTSAEQALKARQDAIDKMRENDFIKQKEHEMRSIESMRQYERDKQDLALNSMNMLLSTTSSTWSSMTSLIKDSVGEQSAVYKGMFLVQQAFAMTSATINALQAYNQVLANPWTFDPITKQTAASITLGMGMAGVGMIAAQTIAGFETGGYTGSGGRKDVAGVVHGQEYVLNAAATKRVGVGTLDAINSGKSMGGGDVVNAPITVNVSVQSNGESSVDTEGQSKQLGQMIGNAVRTVIRQEQRQGGLLSR